MPWVRDQARNSEPVPPLALARGHRLLSRRQVERSLLSLQKSMRLFRFQFRNQLLAAFLSMLVLAAITGGMALWTSHLAQQHLKRSALAHGIHQGYQELASNTYALFKQFGDTLLIGSKAESNDLIENELLLTLERNLKQLRVLVTQEAKIEFPGVDVETVADLQHLALIDRQIAQVVREYREVRDLKDAGRRTRAWSKLASVLEESVDTNFRRLIQEALVEERSDSLTADQDAQNALQRLSATTNALLVASAIFCGLSIYMLRRRVERPLASLSMGTQALSRGDLGHRIAIFGDDEFARLAKSFNHMAGELEVARSNLETSKAALETAIEEQDRELKSVSDAFDKSDQMRRRFLADVSHELRTPLTVIRGEAEVALRGAKLTPDEYRDALRRIVEQAAHTATLVDDLLFVARFDAGDARLAKQPVTAAGLLQTVCRDCASLGQDRRIEVKFTGAAHDGVVSGDPVRLRQLFLIIIDNAVRYSLPDSVVEVSTARSGEDAIIAVSDNGIGIAAEDLQRVFERHYRTAQASRLNSSGTGLGLPMAKAIVEAHTGDIDITSEVRGGTTVTIRLPLSSTDEARGP